MRLAAAARKTAIDAARKTRTNAGERAPDGSARAAVRGFSASNRRSASRLWAMAALRAPTMARRILSERRSARPAARREDRGEQGEGQREERVRELDHLESRPDGPESAHARAGCRSAHRVGRRRGGACAAWSPTRSGVSAFPAEALAAGLQAEETRGADAIGVEHPLDGRRVDVERGRGRRDDGAGQRRRAHVFDVDERVWRLAEREHEGSPFLQADVGGALQQVASDAVGDRAEGPAAAGDHDHSGRRIGARGDRRPHVAVVVEDDAGALRVRNAEGCDPVLRARDARAHLAARDVERGIREDEVELREAAGAERDLHEAAGELCAGAARHADDDLPSGGRSRTDPPGDRFFEDHGGQSTRGSDKKNWTGVLPLWQSRAAPSIQRLEVDRSRRREPSCCRRRSVSAFAPPPLNSVLVRLLSPPGPRHGSRHSDRSRKEVPMENA